MKVLIPHFIHSLFQEKVLLVSNRLIISGQKHILAGSLCDLWTSETPTLHNQLEFSHWNPGCQDQHHKLPIVLLAKSVLP